MRKTIYQQIRIILEMNRNAHEIKNRLIIIDKILIVLNNDAVCDIIISLVEHLSIILDISDLVTLFAFWSILGIKTLSSLYLWFIIYFY